MKKKKKKILMAKKGKDIFLTVLVSMTQKDFLAVIKLQLLNTPIAARYWFTLTGISKRKKKNSPEQS